MIITFIYNNILALFSVILLIIYSRRSDYISSSLNTSIFIIYHQKKIIARLKIISTLELLKACFGLIIF